MPFKNNTIKTQIMEGEMVWMSNISYKKNIVEFACLLVIFLISSIDAYADQNKWSISSKASLANPKIINKPNYGRLIKSEKRFITNNQISNGGWIINSMAKQTQQKIVVGTHIKDAASSQISHLLNVEEAPQLIVQSTNDDSHKSELNVSSDPSDQESNLWSDVRWIGMQSVKNNYVFSTGTQIDDKPVSQFWTRGSFENGFFVDIWANIPLASGNPNNSAEIDYSIGYQKDLKKYGKWTAMLSYYDIETPKLFEFDNDVVGASLRWDKGNFSTEALYFFVDGGRDGYRVSNSYSKQLSNDINVYANLNFADGPFSRQNATIGKLGLSYYPPNWWLDSLGLEFSHMLYTEDDDDPRGFATTFSLGKNLW